MNFKIIDWAGNEIKLSNSVYPQGVTTKTTVWASFEDAEQSLSEWLGDSYESDRGEYYIVEIE